MNNALRYLIIVATTVASLAVPSIADDEPEYSTMTGQVVYSGDRTKLKPLFLKGDAVKDAAICSAEDMPDERLIVDSRTQGVSNVFVWFEKIDPDSIHPDLANKQLTLPILLFEGCRIKPHALCVQTRTGMRVTTTDRIAHNPRDYPLKNSPGCVLLTADLRSDSLEGFIHNFSVSEPGPMKITCDYHTWMSSHVLVQNHPYMTVTKADGSFSIEKIPTGTQRLQIWHELGGRILSKRLTLNTKLHDIGKVEMKISPEVMSSLSFAKVEAGDPKIGASKESE